MSSNVRGTAGEAHLIAGYRTLEKERGSEIAQEIIDPFLKRNGKTMTDFYNYLDVKPVFQQDSFDLERECRRVLNGRVIVQGDSIHWEQYLDD